MKRWNAIQDKLYQNLLRRSITENRKLERQLQKPLNNYDKLYRETSLPFKEDREIHIRNINIPSFTCKDEPSYYNILLSNIQFWRKGEIRDIHRQCMEMIDKRTSSSYTIFQSGKLHGRFDLNENMKYYGMFIFNTQDVTGKHIELLLDIIQRNLRRKLEKAESGHVVFGNLKKDIVRMYDFIDYLDVLRPDMCILTTNYYNVSKSYTNNYTKLVIKEGI